MYNLGVHHQWESHRAFLLRPENELIRSFDPRRRNRCYHWDNRGTCSKGNSCTFIHGDAEYKVCSWMLEKKSKYYNLVFDQSVRYLKCQIVNHSFQIEL